MAGYWSIIVPEAGTNKVLNPVAGLATNVAEVGGANVTQSTTYSYFGGWSHRVETASDNDGIDITLGTLISATTYVTVRVRGDVSPWDWSLNNSDFTAPTLIGTEGNWSVYGLSFPAGQAENSTKLQIYQNGAGACDFYLGHIQVEQVAYATTPITGDQPGCEWNGAAHASTSTRSAQSRAGGRVRDLETIYGVIVSITTGIGLPANKHNTQDQTFLPGALFSGRKILPRTIDLTLTFPGSGNENLHTLRKNLIDVIKWNLVEGDQPFILRYTGADLHKPIDIYCTYDSGLEFNHNPTMNYSEQVMIRGICYDPFFYNVHQTAAHLTTSLTVTDANGIMRRIDGLWQNIDTDFNDQVLALAKGIDGSIYIGGEFTDVGDNDGDGIVRWDPVTPALSSLGSGASGGDVMALAVAPDGTLYAGGTFTQMGGVGDTVRIAKWDGSDWTPLSTGIGSGQVSAIVIGQDGKLYIGGSFTDHHDDDGDYITSWDGDWTSLGTGMNGDVAALAIAPNGDLIAGGTFSTAGGVTVNGVARWNGTAWAAMGTGLSGGTARANALAIDEGGNIYVGGNFTAAGGITASCIAKWNGAAYSALGSGISTSFSIWALALDKNGLLYAGSSSPTIGGLARGEYIAVWNGSSWAHLGIDHAGINAAIKSILCVDDDLYIGGSIEFTGSALTTKLNTVTNGGSANAYPKFIFKRSGGTSARLEYLKNETTGATIWPNYLLLDGEELTIDLSPGNRSIKSSYFGDMWRALLRNSDFADFYLLPGANTISAFVNTAGNPTMTAYALWTDSYLSADAAAP